MPLSTTRPRCAACSASSKVSRPAPQTATHGSQTTRRDTVSPRARARERLGQLAQRAPRARPGPQRCGRPRDFPRGLRRTAAEQHRVARLGPRGMVPANDEGRRRRRRRRRRDRRELRSPRASSRRSSFPADVSWSELDVPAPLAACRRPTPSDVNEAISHCGEGGQHRRRTALVLGGSLTRISCTRPARRQRHVVQLALRDISHDHRSRRERGRRGTADLRARFAIDQLKDCEALILLGAREPASFFAYPDVASRLAPDAAEIIDLVPPGADPYAALAALVDALDAPARELEDGERPWLPTASSRRSPSPPRRGHAARGRHRRRRVQYERRPPLRRAAAPRRHRG